MSERRSTRSAAALKVALREHDARLSLMFETVPVILYTYGVEDGERYRFTSVNQPFLAATGLTRDDVVGRLVDEVIPEPSRSLVLAKYRHAIRERATVRWLETTVYPAGQKVAEVTITPIFDDSGRCTELFGTVYDLTELEQIKSELRARDERIDELATLNRRLDKVTRAKSEFLASMSHELRTPLNAIIGFSDLLVDQLGDRLTPAQQRYFRNVRDAGHHLLELINEVLDLSKVEAGRVELRPDTIALPTLVEPVVASARADAAVRGVAFDTDVPSDGEVRVDAGRLRQILYNLLSNAVKFTDPGGRVRLRAAMDDRALVLEVSDTGIGIAPDKRDRVFGTFERLHEGRSEATGTGLGLALTKHLVEVHGGSIGFESEEGRGTTFHVRIPGVLASPMTGARVLIVEDVERDAELIAAVAAGVGQRTEVVGSALGAREAVRRDPPTAVVLDLRLPDERGERVLEALKADPRTRSIPVIVVTIEDDDGRSRPLGADDHITKPIDRERLAAWLRRIAERDHPAA